MGSFHPDPRRAPPPGRRARRKAELRQRILRAALGLFARQGFLATTVEQITEAADVGKGTFFNYFPTKEHALAGFSELQLEKVRAALAQGQASPRPIQHILRDLIHALAEEPSRSPALVRSLLVANLSSEPVRQLFRRNLARGRRILAQLVALGQQRDEIRRDYPPPKLARLFQQTYFGTLLLWAVHPPSSLTSWLAPSFSLFWSIVVPPYQPPRRERARRSMARRETRP
jgi:AcrR family transcriptional regulator